MAERTVDLGEPCIHLTDLVDQVVRSGEEVVLTRAGEPVARIVPMVPRRARRQFGSARGQLTVPDDFDAPLEDFGGHM